jgi:hypothetical protein
MQRINVDGIRIWGLSEYMACVCLVGTQIPRDKHHAASGGVSTAV